MRKVISKDPYIVEKDGKQYFGRSDRKVCAGCGHHVSLHQYRPDGPMKGGPENCRNCSCKKYLKPANWERVTKAWE